MELNLSAFEFASLPKENMHNHLYQLLEYERKAKTTVVQPKKIAIGQIAHEFYAHEFYDDGNPSHYGYHDVERGSDVIELPRKKIPETHQYQAGLPTTHSQLIIPQESQVAEGSLQILTSPSQFCQSESTTKSIQNCQRPPNPDPRQFAQNKDLRTQYVRSKEDNAPGECLLIKSPPQPFLFTQNSDDEHHRRPPQAEILRAPGLASDRALLAKPHSTTFGLSSGFSPVQEVMQTTRECDNNSLREVQGDDMDSPSAEDLSSTNRKPQNTELGIPVDTNSGTYEANTSDLVNSVLSSILENLEEGGEEEERTYNDVLNSCHIPVLEDSLAMMGNGPTTAGALETVGNEAYTAKREGSHDDLHGGDDYPARKKRRYLELLPAGGFVPAAIENLHSNNGAERDASLRQNDDFPPAGGYRVAASDNLLSKYGIERDALVRRYKDFLLAGGYELAANNNPQFRNGAHSATDSSYYSETAGQRDFSRELSRVPSTIQFYPFTFNLNPVNETRPRSIPNTHGDRNIAVGLQPRIQNPTSDTILPSIESDVVEEIDNIATPNFIPRNQADLGIYSTEAYPGFGGMSLNTAAPDSVFLYAKRLGNQLEAEAIAALMGQPAR